MWLRVPKDLCIVFFTVSNTVYLKKKKETSFASVKTKYLLKKI